MMNSFAEAFKKSILSPRLEEVYQKYLLLRRKYKYSLFVEGNLDKSFYSNVLFYKIGNIFRGDIYGFVCDGKQGVIDICNCLYDKKLINIKSNNVINIVDRDFNSLNDYECKIKDKISITKYYSLESYAFIKDNMDIILNYLSFNEKMIKHFYQCFDQYLEEILDYEALLMCSIKDQIIYISTDLLDKTNIYIKESILVDQNFTKSINQKITSLSSNANSKYENARNLLKKNFLFYRGHDLEKFFDCMMSYYGINAQLKDILKKEELLKKLRIELNFK